MSSPQSSTPNSAFQNRLNRVAERRAPIEAERPEIDVLPDWKENASGPASYVAALLTGVVAVLAFRLVRFHFFGEALVTDSPNLTLALETAGALILSFAIFFLLPWKGIKYKFVQFGGVAVMALAMHNMVHSAPGLFSLAFSPEWTETVIASTEPSSLYVRGHSIPFVGSAGEDVAEAATTEPELPRMIKLGQTSLAAPEPAGD